MSDVNAVRRGRPFVISAPSGCGKTTICHGVLRRDSQIVFSVSHTTRARRAGEVDGQDYHFVSVAKFREMVNAGAFVESAEYAGNLYGTSWAAMEAPLARGLNVLLEIEIQGARQIRERLPAAKLIFILPPSMQELENRLRRRGTDSAEVIDRRLAMAAEEMRQAHWYDYSIVNHELETSIEAVLEIVHGEYADNTQAIESKYGRAVTQAWLREARLLDPSENEDLC